MKMHFSSLKKHLSYPQLHTSMLKSILSLKEIYEFTQPTKPNLTSPMLLNVSNLAKIHFPSQKIISPKLIQNKIMFGRKTLITMAAFIAIMRGLLLSCVY